MSFPLHAYDVIASLPAFQEPAAISLWGLKKVQFGLSPLFATWMSFTVGFFFLVWLIGGFFWFLFGFGWGFFKLFFFISKPNNLLSTSVS